MNRNEIFRTTFKKNFLKEIIMRLDFQGVLSAEMERVLVQVKPYLKDKQFNRYEERIANEIVNNGNAINDIKGQMVYVFVSEARGYEIHLSNTSITILVRSQNYSSFEEYSSVFRHIINIFKNGIDFFTLKRFGLRKINFCFIQDRGSINAFFSPSYYNVDSPIDDYGSLASERLDKLTDKKTSINIRYAIEEGRLEETAVYKITLDSDIYSLDEKVISNIISDEKCMAKTNNVLFKIYTNVLTDKFIRVLSSDEELPKEIVSGVDLNE